jgi:hypothetical protein
MSMGNYHALFKLYEAPKMGAYIMDHFIDRERIKALLVMTKASVYHFETSSSPHSPRNHNRYRTISLSFLQNELAFDDVGAACRFLVEHSCAFFLNPNSPDSEKTLDCKPAAPQLMQAFEEKYRKVNIKGAI